MFSSLGWSIFYQLQILLIFVPGVWAVYFLLDFADRPRTLSLSGLTFSGMIIAVTYIPFHFLTIFVPLVFFALIYYFADLKARWGLWIKYIKTHRFVIILCCFSLLISMVPSAKWYLTAQGEEYAMNLRRQNAGDDESPVGVVREAIHRSGIAAETSFRELFVDLDMPNLRFFYMGIFAYLMFLLSAANQWDRRAAVMFLSGFFVFLIALASVTPVQE